MNLNLTTKAEASKIRNHNFLLEHSSEGLFPPFIWENTMATKMDCLFWSRKRWSERIEEILEKGANNFPMEDSVSVEWNVLFPEDKSFFCSLS